MCGSASGGIKIVKLMLSPPISLTKSPSIGVVAKTLILSEEGSSVVEPLSSVVEPLPQAIKIIDKNMAPILYIGLVFIKFSLIYILLIIQ